ncbi:MAG: PLP-dependent aminotransferase family protein [Bacteroidales bacterium]|nr:PLP-dependent aminotransferase family protein [Bacteroidales bacterium]MBR5720207.1 PLP-dependent aminotransferase family protein [Bacteroidales bacterium]
MIDTNSIFSECAKRMKRSAIRECLKLTQQPDIISFAGGLPSPTSFPYDEIKEIAKEVIENEGAAALQYGTTEGENILRDELVKRYIKEGCNVTRDNFVITTASQQSLDLIGKIFIDEGDYVICELPSYLGGLNSFKIYGAKFIGIEPDEQGMNPDVLEQKILELAKIGKKPKFIYIIPDFQNPAGITMPNQRRKEIIAVAQKYGIYIVEDSPYREIRFEGEPQTMLYALDNQGIVITLGTFSKSFCPGFRLGWIIANKDVLEKFVQAKQTSDLCTSAYLQKIAGHYLQKGLFDKNIGRIVDEYKSKRDNIIRCFKKYFPAGVTWTHPEGGLFLLVTMPEYIDSDDLFYRALEEKVAFVQGYTFFCDGGGRNTFRMNFSFTDEKTAEEGVKRLGDAIRSMMK